MHWSKSEVDLFHRHQNISGIQKMRGLFELFDNFKRCQKRGMP